MLQGKTEIEIDLIIQSAAIVEAAIAEVAKHITLGITTLELDTIADNFIVQQGGVPSFKGYEGFPYASCISVNDAVVHGFPNNYALQDGDVISVDIGVYKNGYHGDSAYSFAIGNVAPEVLQLMKVTKASLYYGIEKAIVGNRIGDIGNAIHHYTNRLNGYGVVKDLVGHGLGAQLHEDPQVPNLGQRGNGHKLVNGLVLAIEPMINLGTAMVITDTDGWTIRTKDGKPSVHYEHDVCVRKGKAKILSSFAKIEQAERDNPTLNASYLD